jgi:hypothetical protein
MPCSYTAIVPGRLFALSIDIWTVEILLVPGYRVYHINILQHVPIILAFTTIQTLTITGLYIFTFADLIVLP